jgi:hypothetical protein
MLGVSQALHALELAGRCCEVQRDSAGFNGIQRVFGGQSGPFTVSGVIGGKIGGQELVDREQGRKARGRLPRPVVRYRHINLAHNVYYGK